MELSKNWRILIFFLIIIQIIALSFISINNNKYTWDEASYIINAKDLSNNLKPHLENYVAHERHPFMSWWIAGGLMLGLPLFLIKLTSIISLILLLLITYRFVKDKKDQDCALLSILFLISIPTLAFLSTKLLSDLTGLLFFTSVLFCYYWGLEKPKYFLLGGLIAGVSIAVRDSNFILGPIIVSFMLFSWKKVNKKYFFLSIITGILGLLPYFIDNYLRWGNPIARIIKHIQMVQEGIGYQASPLQNIPILWIIVIPLLVGLPIFILAVINVYKNRKMLTAKHKLLLTWFFVLLAYFVINQKITPRLAILFFIPIVILGTKELMKKSKKKFFVLLVLILLLNGFLIVNPFILENTHISKNKNQCFSSVKEIIPFNETLYTNWSPPAVVAMQTQRESIFELKPNQSVSYYLYEKPYEKYTQRTDFNSKNYKVIIDNPDCTVFVKELK